MFCKIEVHKAEWQNATVFAPVLAVACVSGPSLGRVACRCGKSDGWGIDERQQIHVI